MRKPVYLFAISLMTLAGPALARDFREDPFAYEEKEEERRQQREEEEEAEANQPTRTFSNSGDFVLSAERLVGYAYSSTLIKQPGDDLTLKVNRVHALTNAGGDLIGSFSVPRIAVDYFVAEGLSLGIGLGYAANSGEAKSQFILASPRIGYNFMFGDYVGLWPRLGGTYQIMQVDDSVKGWLFAGTFDMPLVLVPASHAVITIGPRIDFGFVGEYFVKGEKKQKMTSQEFGFSTGVSLFF